MSRKGINSWKSHWYRYRDKNESGVAAEYAEPFWKTMFNGFFQNPKKLWDVSDVVLSDQKSDVASYGPIDSAEENVSSQVGGMKKCDHLLRGHAEIKQN